MSDQEPAAVHQKGDLKIPERGNVYPKSGLVQGAVFDQPINVPHQDIRTEPTPMLSQPPFSLSAVAFEKLRRPSGKLAGFGWACITLSAINGLRLLLRLSESGFSQPSVASSSGEISATLAISILGTILVLVSARLARTKDAICKEVERFFEANPPKVEFRRPEKTKLKKEISLPRNYLPYDELRLCGNTLKTVKIPFLIGETPLLLIGKNSVPQVWLSAQTSPGSHQGESLVEENRSLNPAVYVDVQDGSRTVYVKLSNIVIIKVRAQSKTNAVIDLLDLRPIGLNVYGDQSGLSFATNTFAGNSMMNSRVAFAIGE